MMKVSYGLTSSVSHGVENHFYGVRASPMLLLFFFLLCVLFYSLEYICCIECG